MNILVTQLDNNIDEVQNVLIFCQLLSVQQIETVLRKTKVNFTECYEISNNDIQHYLFEPCYLTEKDELQILKDFQLT